MYKTHEVNPYTCWRWQSKHFTMHLNFSKHYKLYWLEKKITFLHLIIVTCIIMTKHIIKKVSLRIMTNNGENLKNAVVYEMPESHLGSTVHCVRWKHLWWIRGRQWNVETECGIIIENVCLNKDYHNYDCLNISSPYKKHWYFSNV